MSTSKVTQEKGPMVLISIDASPQAEKAFEFYAANLHKEEHNIVCFHVSEVPVLPSASLYLNTQMLETMIKEEQDKVKALKEMYAAKMRKFKMSGKIKTVTYARPGEAIVEAASGASFVVMGTRGLGTVRRTVLGSVSDYVLHHVTCPIVICHQ